VKSDRNRLSPIDHSDYPPLGRGRPAPLAVGFAEFHRSAKNLLQSPIVIYLFLELRSSRLDCIAHRNNLCFQAFFNAFFRTWHV
jgi:hypothetical protein